MGALQSRNKNEKMKTNTKAPKKRAQRDRTGPKKRDTAGQTSPSPAGKRGESEEQARIKSMMADILREEWKPRLEKRIHFEKWESISMYEGDFRLLFFWGRILVAAEDLARAANLADGFGPDVAISTAEILSMLDARDIIVVPEPRITTNSGGNVGGSYVPLELSIEMLCGSPFHCDISEFHDLLEDFEKLQAWQEEERLRETRLRKARLERVDLRNLRLQKTNLRRAKLRSEKWKP